MRAATFSCAPVCIPADASPTYDRVIGESVWAAEDQVAVGGVALVAGLTIRRCQRTASSKVPDRIVCMYLTVRALSPGDWLPRWRPIGRQVITERLSLRRGVGRRGDRSTQLVQLLLRGPLCREAAALRLTALAVGRPSSPRVQSGSGGVGSCSGGVSSTPNRSTPDRWDCTVVLVTGHWNRPDRCARLPL